MVALIENVNYAKRVVDQHSIDSRLMFSPEYLNNMVLFCGVVPVFVILAHLLTILQFVAKTFGFLRFLTKI